MEREAVGKEAKKLGGRKETIFLSGPLVLSPNITQ
jgi:hypothetical protein